MSTGLTKDRVFVHGSPRAVADCPSELTTLSKHVQGALSFGQIRADRQDGFAVRRLHAVLRGARGDVTAGHHVRLPPGPNMAKCVAIPTVAPFNTAAAGSIAAGAAKGSGPKPPPRAVVPRWPFALAAFSTPEIHLVLAPSHPIIGIAVAVVVDSRLRRGSAGIRTA